MNYSRSAILTQPCFSNPRQGLSCPEIPKQFGNAGTSILSTKGIILNIISATACQDAYQWQIFHTGTGSLAGKEDILPGPDNPSKMRRSVENAEHVGEYSGTTNCAWFRAVPADPIMLLNLSGLFAPRAGQHFRDEQRRRRSQYDRGTRLAELEDSYDYGTHGYHGEEVYRPSGIGSRQYGNVPDGYNATF